MEKIAQIIGNKIANELNFKEQKKQVIIYGLIALIQTVITFLMIIIIGLIFSILIEALIVCLSLSLLRKYSGGAHLSSIEICTAISVIFSILFSLLCKYILLTLINTNILIILLILVFVVAFFAIYKLAPVDSPNKPIKTEKKKKRMKKGSYITLTFFLIISIVFLFIGMYYKNFNSYLLCMFLGILWQVFTLTSLGHRFYKLINFI
jgi:accessory gene regulator B